MNIIIQRYVGLNDRNCPIWLDTAWGSLAEARNAYSGDVFREVYVDRVDIPTFWATASDVRVRPCCKHHVI